VPVDTFLKRQGCRSGCLGGVDREAGNGEAGVYRVRIISPKTNINKGYPPGLMEATLAMASLGRFNPDGPHYGLFQK